MALTVNGGTEIYDNGSFSGASPLFWNMEPWELILTIIAIFVLIAWIASLLFILWGALLLILSWGKDDKIKPAINTIRYAVIGLIAIVFAIFVFPMLWKMLWLNVEQYAKPANIFRKIEEIGNNLFGRWDGATYIGTWGNGSTSGLPDDFTDL